MTKTEAFDKFLNNIKVDNPDIFCGRYKEITKKLNKTFRDTDSETANCLQVGYMDDIPELRYFRP